MFENLPKFKTILKREKCLRKVKAIDYMNLKVCVEISSCFEWHIPKYIFESTYYKDKEENEIYEGDIIDWGKHSRGIVMKEKGQWVISNSNGFFPLHGYCNDGKIVGNKILNKDMLKHPNLIYFKIA
ncbi:hypothetical protein CP985_14180 [Malaciobacter mytili LMG 24559]|uniref:YopX protein domain-containing protein n=1 Tax=Malaciobacter mytili LMG 24559 TaxID=1032238 RepID=A0AAX2ABB6_9BACT|nr:YopX family protein [Malaciobacter mytili]AXH16341.1 hypothetical protein AMYT_a0041 [Malaciobacter mytili LMG 24559]RXK12861.1 hypothetical protein CP985_14180 [Malaciobacter mytili LMG 24559]